MNQEPKSTPTLAPEGQRADTEVVKALLNALYEVMPYLNELPTNAYHRLAPICHEALKLAGDDWNAPKREPAANTLSPQDGRIEASPIEERIERTVKCCVCGWYTPGVPQKELIEAKMKISRLAAPKVVDSKEEQEKEKA